MNLDVAEMALRLYPQNQSLRMKWVEAVKILRNSSKQGWILDYSVRIMGLGVTVTPPIQEFRTDEPNEREDRHQCPNPRQHSHPQQVST
jgi:hypothetical protein